MQQQSFLFTTPSQPSRRNLVIEAGAGTGKTTAIVGEVLKLMLEREQLAPERIVLMTFTEKAAGEIADRIRTALEELAVHPGPWPRESANPLVIFNDAARAAHHAANIDKLRSQTIHSFCQSLLRTFPIEAGLDPQFAIVEGFERALLYGQLYDAWLDHETRVAPLPEIEYEWELVFAHAGYLFQIRDLILGLIDRRDLLSETHGFGDFHEDVERKLEDAVLWIRSDTATCKDSAAARVAEYLRATPFGGGSMDAWIEYLQPIAANIRQIDFRYCGALKEPMTFLRAGDRGNSVYDRLVGHRATMALVALTRRFIDFLDAEKRKLGVVDFDDLLLRTAALLDNEEVLARARAQFDFIFVDEFQDTDRTQARIIDRLARDASGAFVPGKTVVVGDPKQSIYGFRRADPETYYQMTQSLRDESAEYRILGEQYRSDAPLVDAINQMFERLFPLLPHDPNVFRPDYKPLRAARPKPRRELEARLTMLAASSDDKSDRYFAEAEAIAEWIKSKSDGDLKRFAILFRRLTKLDDYLDTFDKHGIDYVLPPTRMFLDRRAPVDLVAVLRAIAYPFDRGAQISAARTPYFALTDEEIAQGVIPSAVEESPSAGDPSTSLGMTPWSTFTDSISKFREASHHLTVAELIDLLIDTTRIERVYDAAADGFRHARHLEHVRAIAFDYDQRIGGSVRQFVEEIDRRRSGEPDEMEPSLIDESQNAVRIMSVHAAKGLEFETVILPDLAFQSGSEGLNLFSVEEPKKLVLSGRAESISAHFLGLAEIAGQREEAESRRLFYVAVTRAMTDVVFVVNPEEKRSVGFHRSLLECLGIDRKDVARYWPGPHETAAGLVSFEKLESSGAGQTKRRRLRDAELEEQLLSSEIVPAEIASPPVVAEALTAGEIAARRAGSRNRGTGILLHRVMELWDGREDAGKLLDRVAAESAADAEAVQRVRQRLGTIARSEMLQRIARAETIGREVPLRFVENGVMVERRIDRLLREDGQELVIDYKSGAYEEHRAERDRVQVKKYCEAVSAMTGRPCSGAIWYVDVDGDKVVPVQ
jgi:ATP-dependent helicase/nuclease subunit A